MIQAIATENAIGVTIKWILTYLLKVPMLSYCVTINEGKMSEEKVQTVTTPMKPSNWIPAAMNAMIPKIKEAKLGVAEPTTIILDE
jgi:hypothetical protein